MLITARVASCLLNPSLLKQSSSSRRSMICLHKLPAKALSLLHLQMSTVELGLLRRGRDRSGLGSLLAIFDVIYHPRRRLIEDLRLKNLQDDLSVAFIWV